MKNFNILKKAIKIILLEIFVIIIGTITQAVSENTFTAKVIPENKNIKPGEEITLTLSVSDINMGEDGINTLEGTIEYDKELFEEIKSDSIKSLNNWTTTFNDERSMLNGKFLSVNLTGGVKEDSNIFTITMKVKDTIDKTTSTKINFKDLTSNDGTDLVNAGTKTINVTIEVEKEEEKNNNNIVKNEVSGEQTNTENKNNNSKVNKFNDTQSSNRLPYAGKAEIIIIAIGLIVIIALYLWIKNLNYKDI